MKKLSFCIICIFLLLVNINSFASAEELTEMFSESFESLSRTPDGWNVYGTKGVNYSLTKTGITSAPVNGGTAKVYKTTEFDVSSFPYMVEFSFAHYSSGTSYVHIGAKSGNSAISTKPVAEGYSIEFTTKDYKKAGISMLGYSMKLSDYEKNKMATGMGLFYKTAYSGSGYICNYDLAQMIYNSLYQPFATNNKKCLFDNVLKLTKVKGQVTDNGITAIGSKSKVAVGSVVINGVSLENKTNYAPMSLIGRMVEGYYNEDYELLFVKYLRNERVLHIDAGNITDFSSFKFTYDDVNTGKSKLAYIKPGASVIFNGENVKSYKNDLFKNCEHGDIWLISSDNSTKYDTVIAECYENFVVASVYASENTIYNAAYDIKSEDNRRYKIDLSDYRNIDIFDSMGNPLKFEDLKTDNVLSVSASDEYLKMIVSTAQETAFEITGINRDGDGRTVIRGKEKAFKVSDSYFKAYDSKEFKLGTIYALLLSCFGDIAWVQFPTDYQYESGCLAKVTLAYEGRNDFFASHPPNIQRGLVNEKLSHNYDYNLFDQYRMQEDYNDGFSYYQIQVSPGWLHGNPNVLDSDEITQTMYRETLEYAKELVDQGKLRNMTTSEFGEYYKQNIPIEKANVAVGKEMLYGSGKHYFWICSPATRVLIDCNQGGSIGDLRPFVGEFEAFTGVDSPMRDINTYPYLIQSQYRTGIKTHYVDGSRTTLLVKSGDETVDCCLIQTKTEGIERISNDVVLTLTPMTVEFKNGGYVKIQTVYKFGNDGCITITRKILEKNTDVKLVEYFKGCCGFTEYPEDLSDITLFADNDNFKFGYNSNSVEKDNCEIVGAIIPKANVTAAFKADSRYNSHSRAKEGYLFNPFYLFEVEYDVGNGEECVTCLTLTKM